MPERRPSIPRPRIEGLSDLIFGLALSIGAIQLVSVIPQTHMQLVTSISAFAFSFLILIGVWNRYTTIVSVVPVETTILVRLNMLLLFFVALEPYLFNLLFVQSAAQYPLAPDVSAYFGLDIGGMNFILAYFTHAMTKEEKRQIPAELIRPFKISRDALFASGLLFAVSALPELWTIGVSGVPLRFILWIVTIPLAWVFRLATRMPTSGVLEAAAGSPD